MPIHAGSERPEMEAVRWHPVPQAPPSLFRADVHRGIDSYAAFYAPGCLCVVPPAAADAFEAAVVAGSAAGGWAASLHAAATRAQSRARSLCDVPFRPECLTLYLNQVCNLHCTYCFADPSAPDPSAPNPSAPDPAWTDELRHAPRTALPATLDLASIDSAARLVAANCREKDLPFYVGLHGGGEPLIDPPFARAVLDLLDEVARQHRVQPFYYVATNGVIPEAVAHWLAARVHLVGLSCDGPPAVHNRQRPSRAGHPTLPIVERTARVLRDAGTPFRVRATITRHGVGSLPGIVDDLCRRLAPQQVHVEPVYGGGRSRVDQSLRASDAAAFVEGYLAACAVAESHGVQLTTSGSRLDVVHGPYCHLFRQVLNLVPGGVATACFKTATAAAAQDRGVVIGARNPSGRFELDDLRVTDLRTRLSRQPVRCDACVNRYHCAGDCPDVCRLNETDRDARSGGLVGTSPPDPGFRCAMLHALTVARLDRRASELWAQVAAGAVDPPHGTSFS